MRLEGIADHALQLNAMVAETLQLLQIRPPLLPNVSTHLSAEHGGAEQIRSSSALLCDRQYWTCGSEGSTCGFFQWEDPPAAQFALPTSPVKPYEGGYAVNDIRDTGDEGDDASGDHATGFKCECGMPATTRTSNSARNPGRSVKLQQAHSTTFLS